MKKLLTQKNLLVILQQAPNSALAGFFRGEYPLSFTTFVSIGKVPQFTLSTKVAYRDGDFYPLEQHTIWGEVDPQLGIDGDEMPHRKTQLIGWAVPQASTLLQRKLRLWRREWEQTQQQKKQSGGNSPQKHSASSQSSQSAALAKIQQKLNATRKRSSKGSKPTRRRK